MSAPPSAPDAVAPPGAFDPTAIALVAAGGVVGAAARWAVATTWPTPVGGAGWAILGVNLAGCALIGLLAGWLSGAAVRRGGPTHRDHLVRLALATGVLGGFTTFSTLAVETDRALADGDAAGALVVLGVSIVGGLVLAAGGSHLGARAGRRDATGGRR